MERRLPWWSSRPRPTDSVPIWTISVTPPCFDRCMFAIADHLDELRCWPTDRLERRRTEVVQAKRRLDTEELAIVRVLDERGLIDPTVGDQGESARTFRDKV